MIIYSDKTGNNERVVRIFGIKVYKKSLVGYRNKIWTKRKLLFGLFKTLENQECKLYYLLGIRIFKKRKFLISRNTTVNYNKIAAMTQRIITTALLHQKTFLQFKGCHKGKDVVLVAAGPTVNYYVPFADAVHVGVNRAFKKEDIKFDYLFTIDKEGLYVYADEFYNYNCIKFVGDQNIGINFQLPEDFSNNKQTYRYKTNAGCLSGTFYVDIDSSPLVNAATVAIQAMQFILYTQPKRIFLVGTDCTGASKQHFLGNCYDISLRGENAARNDECNILYWKKIKDFAAIYYPNTEIISINPVRLKGVFKDVYTKKYLEDNPALKEESGSEIELLK